MTEIRFPLPATGHPSRIGPYRLLAKIGEGGMGVVHLAEEPSGRRVAIKVLRPHIVGDDHGRARMAREVTSLRRVRSPRVAEVYDADPWGETPYVVTRYVPGPSLHDHADEHGPIHGQALEVLALGLAEALVAVHAADVLHRDIKPANVLLEGRNPVLIDFGLAQLSDDSRLTRSGWLLGTPGYLAPEILYGEVPTPGADVHAWAATVVFAATGHGPYGSGPAFAVMDRVRRGEHDLSQVPDALYWVVRRSLMPDPRDRPTADELRSLLVSAHRPARPSIQAQSVTTRVSLPRLSAAGAAPPSAETALPAAAVVDQQRGGAVAPPSSHVSARSAPAQPWAEQPWAEQSAAEQFLPVPTRRAPRFAAVMFWLAVLAVVLAGSAAAPLLTSAGLFGAAWMLRTGSARSTALEGWRRQRGPRRGDRLLATVCWPWFALVSLPGAMLSTALALTSAAGVVVAATVAAPPRALVWVLMLGGAVAAIAVWSGPWSRPVRSAGGGLTAAVLRPGLPGALVVGAVLVAAAAILVVRQFDGPVYEPLPPPPWEQPLRDLVTSTW